MSTKGVSARQQDERALAFVAARSAGMSPANIARAHKTSPQNVSDITRAVRAADLAHSDPSATPEQIAEAYW